jgi:glutamyl-tRNA reductase
MRQPGHELLQGDKGQEELERALRRLSRGEDPQQVLEAFSRRLTNRLMHEPTVKLYHLLGHEGRA